MFGFGRQLGPVSQRELEEYKEMKKNAGPNTSSEQLRREIIEDIERSLNRKPEPDALQRET